METTLCDQGYWQFLVNVIKLTKYLSITYFMEVRYVLIVIVISYKLAKVITISDIYFKTFTNRKQLNNLLDIFFSRVLTQKQTKMRILRNDFDVAAHIGSLPKLHLSVKHFTFRGLSILHLSSLFYGWHEEWHSHLTHDILCWKFRRIVFTFCNTFYFVCF
jgi:hypothetical protein